MSRRERLFAKRLLRASNNLDADEDSQAHKDAMHYLDAVSSGQRETAREVVFEILDEEEK